MIIKRGDIFLADLGEPTGSEQGRIRPCIVVQNDIANEFSPTTIIVPTTSKIPKKYYPTTVVIEPAESGLKEKSSLLCNQIRTISIDDRIIKKIGSLKTETMKKVDEALKTSLGIE